MPAFLSNARLLVPGAGEANERSSKNIDGAAFERLVMDPFGHHWEIGKPLEK
jgi:hypothetical protein